MVNLSKPITFVSSLWVSCSRPKLHARIRLFCFPYAGAGSSLFYTWSNLLVPEIELYLVHLPGRDGRIREAPYRQLCPLIEQLTEDLIPYLDKPFAFFGHSMGSLISFEVARQLRRRNGPQPIHLFVSGRQPPHGSSTTPNMHHLPEKEFLETAQRYYGALPEIILQDSELVSLFASMMRADVTMVETHEYEPEVPLDCGITAYGGLHDLSVTEDNLTEWREQTTAGFNLKMLPGEHFFIQSARAALIQDINNRLIELLKQYDPEGTG
jgi:medium-chain acyl-[acyl-carrier-protein] hydrolase